jgi:histone-lysine N-methyltransferase SETMAR
LNTGVLLQHNNARPHTARSTVATIQDLSFECLPHPPYSPDLAPSDFHVFGLLKQAMGGKSFRSDKEVQQAVSEWLCSQPKEFFLEVSMHFRNTGTLVLNAVKTT